MKLYDWKADLTDAEIATVRRRHLADLLAALRDACGELHTLLAEPPAEGGTYPPLAAISTDPRDHT